MQGCRGDKPSLNTNHLLFIQEMRVQHFPVHFHSSLASPEQGGCQHKTIPWLKDRHKAVAPVMPGLQ